MCTEARCCQSTINQEPVLKTFQAEPSSLFALLKERVWHDLKRFKNWLQVYNKELL